jgi:hypothetical protein
MIARTNKARIEPMITIKTGFCGIKSTLHRRNFSTISSEKVKIEQFYTP